MYRTLINKCNNAHHRFHVIWTYRGNMSKKKKLKYNNQMIIAHLWYHLLSLLTKILRSLNFNLWWLKLLHSSHSSIKKAILKFNHKLFSIMWIMHKRKVMEMRFYKLKLNLSLNFKSSLTINQTSKIRKRRIAQINRKNKSIQGPNRIQKVLPKY